MKMNIYHKIMMWYYFNMMKSADYYEARFYYLNKFIDHKSKVEK